MRKVSVISLTSGCLFYSILLVPLRASYPSGVFNDRNPLVCDTWNCSQQARSNGDRDFNCVIEGEKEWLQRIKHFQLPVTGRFPWRPHPPLITKLHLMNATKSNSSLNITFKLPYDEYLDIQAVVLKFTSVKETSLQDPGYRLPLYRIFNFSAYRTSMDRTVQREISYGCLSNLDKNGMSRVYRLTLIALPYNKDQKGASLEHFVTVSYTLNKNWKPTISLSFYPRPNDIRVVFEEAPVGMGINHYTIVLYRRKKSTKDEQVGEKILFNEQYTYVFTNLTSGSYVVKVIPQPQPCSPNCEESESYPIELNEENEEQLPEEIVDQSKYIIIGVVLAVVLLVIVAVIHFKVKRQRRVIGKCILLPTCNGEQHRRLISEIAAYIRNGSDVTPEINSDLQCMDQMEFLDCDRLITQASQTKSGEDEIRIVFLCTQCGDTNFSRIENYIESVAKIDILFLFTKLIEESLPHTLKNIRSYDNEEPEALIQNLDSLIGQKRQTESFRVSNRDLLIRICNEVFNNDLGIQFLELSDENNHKTQVIPNNCPVHG